MGDEFKHIPIMLKECIESLSIKPDGTYIDCTLGGAGHSSEILKKLGRNGLLIGIDQDQEAIDAAGKRLKDISSNAVFIIEKANFENLDIIARKNGVDKADGILMDIGVSSHQLDQSGRGFSYNEEAPLDMRMDRNIEITAYDVLNNKSAEELTKIIRDFGEERWASRIAKFIVERRKTLEMKTTFDLVKAIKSAIPAAARREGPHPAKRTFQAIRIYVNDELGVLERTTLKAAELLKKGGRLVIISFHSLEDRIVKNTFQKLQNPCECPKSFPQCICGKKQIGKIITGKPIIAKDDELIENPRARSAKLRVLERI